MSARSALAWTAVVLLAAGLGVVSYLHWGPGGDEAGQAPETDGTQAAGSQTGDANASQPTAAGPPTWEAPTWREGERWTYRVWTPEGVSRAFLEVRDAEAVHAGRPAYEVFRSADNRTVHFDRETTNRLTPNGTEVEIFAWPLTEGAAWNLTGAGDRRAQVQAQFVEDVVTPVGLLDGYKLTAEYADSNLVEVYYYVDEYRSYVRLENYRDGRMSLSMRLVAHGIHG